MNFLILTSSENKEAVITTYIEELISSLKVSKCPIQVYQDFNGLLVSLEKDHSNQVVIVIKSKQDSEDTILEELKMIRDTNQLVHLILVYENTSILPKLFESHLALLDFIPYNSANEIVYKRIKKVLLYLLTHFNLGREKKIFAYQTKLSQISIPFEDIIYFETSPNPHRLIVYTEKESIEFYGKISDLTKYDDRLFRCHRSFVINPSKVRFMNRRSKVLTLQQDYSCYIARGKVRELMQVLQDIKEKNQMVKMPQV